jgi:hypothetical protein
LYSLSKYAGRVGNLGKPLPDPFPIFEFNKWRFRYGGTSMIAGKPGSFKSVLALNMLVFWAKQGLEILHFSADSDEGTVMRRVSAILSGDDAEYVERALMTGGQARYIDEMTKVCQCGKVEYPHPLDSHWRFAYRQMEIDDILNQVECFEAAYGAYPDIAFFDNLIDFVERPDDWGGMLNFTKDLDALAREKKMHVCILHHAKRDKDQDPGKAPADWEIQGKVTQIPRLVFTMGALNGNVQIACVKDTNGPNNDPQGYHKVYLEIGNNLRVIEKSWAGTDNAV